MTRDLSTSWARRSSTCERFDTRPRADGLDRLEREPAREHRQAPEQRPLRRGQQVVAPVQRRAERLLARRWSSGPRPSASRKRSFSRATICSTLRSRTRAAASSMASGRPSSRRQSSTTAGAFSSVSAKSGVDQPGALDEEADGLEPRQVLRRARSPSSGRASGGTRKVLSPGMLSRSRLVASTRSCGHARTSVSASSAQAPMRCSQLSRISSACRPASAAVRISRGDRGASSGRPSADATACATRRAVPHAGQLDEPDAVRAEAPELGADGQGEPGLADPAGAR